MEGMELLTQEKIRMLGKKYKRYLRTLAADTIKQVVIKENIKKGLPQEKEKTTRNQTI